MTQPPEKIYDIADPNLRRYRANLAHGTKKMTRKSCDSTASRRASKVHWDPKWIGVIQGYPKSLEAFEQRKFKQGTYFRRLKEQGLPLPTRKGVPDGFAGQKNAIQKYKADAAKKADIIMEKLEKNDLLRDDVKDDDIAKSAIHSVLVIMNDASEKSDIRLKAASTLLTYTKAKPVQKIEAKVSQAEAWLASLAEQNED